MQDEIEPFVPMMARDFPDAAQHKELIEEVVFAVTSYLTARFGEPRRPPFTPTTPELEQA